MRTSPRNPLDHVTARALELARDNAAADKMSGANGAAESGTAPGSFTTLGTNGGTVGPFFWDLDGFDNADEVFGM